MAVWKPSRRGWFDGPAYPCKDHCLAPLKTSGTFTKLVKDISVNLPETSPGEWGRTELIKVGVGPLSGPDLEGAAPGDSSLKP